MNVDIAKEPLGVDQKGKKVFLKDIWPSNKEIGEFVAKNITKQMFTKKYADVFKGDSNWRKISVKGGMTYDWDKKSTYVQNPPYFVGMGRHPKPLEDIVDARVLALLLDSITTDHISPAGSIKVDSPAGKYLVGHKVKPADFNQYGTRRGNHEVMMRGTFANIRIKNQMVPGVEGGVTVHYPSKQRMPIYDAAMKYKADRVPLVVFAGKEYGSGSSRDWAAKGSVLLGVRAVIAQSFERIHRSNLVGMGVMPLVFEEGTSWQSLGLKGRRAGDDPRPAWRAQAASAADRRDRLRQWHAQARAADLPHRYAGRTRLLQEWRHSAVRAASIGGLTADSVNGQQGKVGHSPRSEWRVIDGALYKLFGEAGDRGIGMNYRHITFAAAFVCTSTAAPASAEPRAVIELFTSQGCSSCPAADKLLGELSRDPSLVTMSLAVDYWDYLGWKDTLALHGHSNRQRAYAEARGDREVYTPQVVVNGVVHVLGSDKAAIEKAIAQTRRNRRRALRCR